jgi:hypothetical protein
MYRKFLISTQPGQVAEWYVQAIARTEKMLINLGYCVRLEILFLRERRFESCLGRFLRFFWSVLIFFFSRCFDSAAVRWRSEYGDPVLGAVTGITCGIIIFNRNKNDKMCLMLLWCCCEARVGQIRHV